MPLIFQKIVYIKANKYKVRVKTNKCVCLKASPVVCFTLKSNQKKYASR